eukprot:TRINITY_DN35410_c0_g2_i1.p1 TRINITY_DN35410_c0_g2~~TRINITY_DN35410_c0_g2_i1.p1  ORF type:complete len:172 (+),score=24.94 TRINITY_DN35410_c0_g2_i1:80-595(+)
MPVTYPGLVISIKKTFLHFDFGSEEPSTPRAKKRSSSWSGDNRSTAMDVCIHRDASRVLSGGCSDEAEYEAPSVPEADAATGMLFPQRPGMLHGSITNEDGEICSWCGQPHRVRARPSKTVREKIKRDIIWAREMDDESQRTWHLEAIVERHGHYACKIWQAFGSTTCADW